MGYEIDSDSAYQQQISGWLDAYANLVHDQTKWVSENFEAIETINGLIATLVG